jgi:hypothetical protein
MARHTDEDRQQALSLLAAGKTQGEVSRQTGIPQPTISRWASEEGKSNSTPHQTQRERKSPQSQANAGTAVTLEPTITTTDAELQAHPLANLFPMMVDADFMSLQDDIAAQGLLEPLWLYEGQTLDGRNRYKACKELGISPQVRTYQGNDPLGFVLSMNLIRRHLTESQRALAGAEAATMRQGRRTDREPSANLPEVSQTKASKLFNISERSIRDAKRVKEEAQPEVVQAVRDGHLAVSAAAKLSQEPGPVQRQILAQVMSGGVPSVTHALRTLSSQPRPPLLQDDLDKLSHMHISILERWPSVHDRQTILRDMERMTDLTRAATVRDDDSEGVRDA